MPDWLIHMGAAHLLGRPRARFDVRWLLLGAVLPDAIPRVLGIAIAKVELLQELTTSSVSLYLGLLHTPFSVFLLAAALVTLAVDQRVAAVSLALGAGSHFALDLLQRSFGAGTSLLYPISLRQYSLQVGWYESPPTYVLVPLFGLYLLVLTWRARPPARPALDLGPARLRWAALPLLVCFAVPALCIDRAVALDIGNTRLAAHREAYEGRDIQMAVVAVEEVDGDRVLLDRADTLFAVDWAGQPPVEPGQYVSLRGVYHDTGIEPTEIFVHDYRMKTWASLLGLLLLVVLWLRGRGVSASAFSGLASPPPR